jgi:hypothetical protein
MLQLGLIVVRWEVRSARRSSSGSGRRMRIVFAKTRFLRPFLPSVATTLLMLATAACHNTAQGVKADTRRALDKTGKALERAGDKIDGHPKKDR